VPDYQFHLYFKTTRMDRFLKETSLFVPRTSKIVHEAANTKYDDAYIQVGFTCFDSGSDSPKPQCVLCYEILANDAMRPCRLKRHLETKHPESVKKPKDFFRRKLVDLQNQNKIIAKQTTPSSKALFASYAVALCVAKATRTIQ
jgi:hypothetical protein